MHYPLTQTLLATTVNEKATSRMTVGLKEEARKGKVLVKKGERKPTWQ